MGSQIELLYMQGMPRKVGKSVEHTLMKRRNCAKCGTDSENNSAIEDNEELECTCDNRKRQRRHNMKSNQDIIAITTQWTRHGVNWAYSQMDLMKKSQIYR